MTTKILVLNSGSSSVKYRLFDLNSDQVLASGMIERIGETLPGSHSGEGTAVIIANHRQAIDEMVRRLKAVGVLADEGDLAGIGHRVVHGGETFHQAVRVNDTVIAAIREAIPLAPLHNPPNLLGIEVCRELWPEVPQVAVFDTAFHQSMPPHAYRYALPESCYRELRIRRYGFHGTSFASVTRQAADYLKISPENLNFIALHLGNGCSIAAIKGGKSIDTSMGMTPLAGLMMGTRCGDIDPGVLLYFLGQGRSIQEVERLLNRESGLKGVAGVNDMRDLLARVESKDEQACLSLDMFCYRIKKYIGSYYAILGRVDALIFTGGIGEHAAPVRQRICSSLEHLGLGLDEAVNIGKRVGITELQSSGSLMKILIIPTDEELEIARQTGAMIG
jgi:acetate kinase